jgi:D-alanyl-D-alanine carboxypeptidase (penicillin-binding protein 5/6)
MLFYFIEDNTLCFKLKLGILKMNNWYILAYLTSMRNKVVKKTCSITLGFIVSVPMTCAVAQVARVIPAPEIDVTSYILMDQNTGFLLGEKNADQRVEPASITKIMTTYVAGHALREGLINLEDEVSISTKAWQTGGSKMFIEAGKKVTVDALLDGVIVISGNDASVALAEHIAGTEQTFSAMMNDYAKQLGMVNSNFANASGYPDPETYVSARDVAVLSRALIREFPALYMRFSKKEYTFNNIKQPNRNRLLFRDNSVDGIKTGHTQSAGYCLVSSAIREDVRLIAVVMGSSSDGARTDSSQSLINYGYRFFESKKFYRAGDKISSQTIWRGSADSVPVGVLHDVDLVIPRGTESRVEIKIEIDKPVLAPLEIGQSVGTLDIFLDEKLLSKVPLVSLENVEEGSFFSRLWDDLILFFEFLFAV